jgi:hypothetical protein
MFCLEAEGRAGLRVRRFPLEAMGGAAAPRRFVEQEWQPAAIPEPLGRVQAIRRRRLGGVNPYLRAKLTGVYFRNEAAFLDFDLRVICAFLAEP